MSTLIRKESLDLLEAAINKLALDVLRAGGDSLTADIREVLAKLDEIKQPKEASIVYIYDTSNGIRCIPVFSTNRASLLNAVKETKPQTVNDLCKAIRTLSFDKNCAFTVKEDEAPEYTWIILEHEWKWEEEDKQ